MPSLEVDISIDVDSKVGMPVGISQPPPSQTDEDFYDDISIETNRDEPSTSKPSPAPSRRQPEVEASEPILVDPPLDVRPSSARRSDPDRTPLPVADDDGLFADSEAAPEAPMPTLESRPVVATRVPAVPFGEHPATGIPLPEQAEVRVLEPAYLRDQLALYDTERLLKAEDAPRAARLACAAGRVCEQLGDLDGAEERYEAALELDSSAPIALRGLRRVRLATGKSDRVVAMLEREIEKSSPAEKRALEAIKAELHLQRGDRDLAREAFRDILEQRPDDLGAALGLADVASAEGPDELAEALGRVAEALGPTGDARLKAAVAVERGRLDEQAGRVRDAVTRYREALALDPQATGAVWGLLYVAVRTPGEADDVDTHLRLAELLPRGPLRGAIERRLGLLNAIGYFERGTPGDPSGARPHLQAAAGGAEGDPLALRALADLERSEGRLDEAITALSRLVETVGDPGRRADLLFTIGELNEQKGNTGAAAASYQRAASEFSDDPRAARALERTQLAGGDKESALQRHLSAAGRDATRAPIEWTRAARLLDELGRRDEALARLTQALAQAPGFQQAVELAVELHLLAGKPDDAAGVLERAAESADDAASGIALRERAARLWHKAGRREEALAAVRPLVAGGTETPDDTLPSRWLEQRLMQATIDAQELADSLRAEAEQIEPSDRARAAALWHRRGLLLAVFDAEGARDSQRRALALDPGAGPAAVELAAQLLRDGAASDLPAVYQARLPGAAGRPEAIALEHRLAVSLADDANDLPAAQKVAAHVAAQAGSDIAAAELVQRLGRRAGDDAPVLEALDRELAAATDIDLRFALLVAIGERLERRGQPDRGAERYRLALELKPGQPGALFALERAYRTSKNFSALADLALSDLKDATDTRRKVGAYEKLAFIDGVLRGDQESALLGMESIIEVDHAHHGAMRVLERQYLAGARWPELVALYEQLGLTANDPAFAAAVHLDRARLRKLVQATSGRELPAEELQAAVDNDNRLALFKESHSRPALRHVLSRARFQRDLPQVAELYARLADAVTDDGRTAAVCLTRAAEALVELDKGDEAKQRFLAAVERGGSHLPALAGLVDLCLQREDWAGAVDAAEQAGQALKDVDARAGAYLLAGVLAEEKLADYPRALGDLRQALAIEPRNHEAFDRLRGVLVATKDFTALAELYRQRLEVETDGMRMVELHLELAKIARDHLLDRERARTELRAVLQQDAAHAEALQLLADLYYEDQQWLEAAETLIKRARIEKGRSALKDIFFKLGIIYSEKLPDPKRAVASFTRVVKADPNDLVALEHLSNLYLKEWDYKGALEATKRLADLEKDKLKRIGHLHRIAKIYEEGFKDARNALQALRAALEIDAMYLGSIGELARFFDRQSDVQSMRVHLDRTSARVRTLLEKDPYDVEAFRALFKIFGWRRAPDRAALAAGVLEHLGQAESDEKAMLGKLAGRDPYPGSALADAALDETLFDSRVPAGFRHLFRLLDEPLGKMFRADLKRLGINKSERLPRSGHAVRDIANRMATDLGIREFDLYITAQHPTALMVELTEPLSIVIGAKLVEGAHEHEIRFLLGRVLKMMQCHMALPMRLSSDDLGVLVGAIVRQFVPDFVPAGFDEKQVAAEGARMSKLIPKKMQGELFPFAMECASNQLDLKLIGPALIDTANRAGLLACGLIGPALTALKRLGDDGQVRALLRFAMSEEMAELRRQAGTSIG